MTANIYVISAGVNYYISLDGAKRTYYSGSGTPWTVQSTTPYDLAMNDVTGQRWSPRASQRQEVYGGGPPFRNGQTLIYDSYGNVTETVPIQLYATSHDNAVALLRQLRQILNTALYSVPAVLAVQPDGATNTVYYEIYGADVQEDPKFINDESQPFQAPQSKGVLRAQITWRRSPFGGTTALSTLLNAQVFTNVNTGNTVSLGALTGDMINEGQPMNIRSAPSASNDVHLLATVVNHSHLTSIIGAKTTTSTSFISYGVGLTFNSVTVRDNRACRVRVLLRWKTTLTNPSKARVRVSFSPSGGGGTIYTFPVRALGTDTTGQLLDIGGVDLSMLRNSVTSPPLVDVNIEFASSDGTSVTITLDYAEVLIYYDYCVVITPIPAQPISAACAQKVNGGSGGGNTAWLPQNTPQVYAVDNADNFFQICQARGTIPRAFSGASLWMAMLTQATLAHDKTHTATITAKMAPLYATLRGSG